MLPIAPLLTPTFALDFLAANVIRAFVEQLALD
jgi:hypothetical protein